MVDIGKLVNKMSTLKHFKGLTFSDIESIVRAGQIRQVSAGSTIVMEEHPCAGLFVLLGGQAHLYRLGPDGQEILMDVIKPIIMFNELAILDGGPNPFTAIAAKDSLVWNAPYGALLELSKAYPQVALGFLPVLAKRNRALIDMVADICFMSVRARTAKLLLDLSKNGREIIARQDHTIYKMSAQISTVPEAISRSLRYFREEGLIDSTRTTITVYKADKLAELAMIDTTSEAA